MVENRAQRIHDGRSLRRLPDSYVAVDVETTGLDFKQCDIIEIGAVRVSNGEVGNRFTQLVRIDHELNPFIVRLTGITDEMLKSAGSLREAIEELSEFIGGSVVLVHNASFDMNFLGVAYREVFGKSLSNDYVDTLFVARKALPGLSHHRLLDVCKELKVSNGLEHRALSDSVALVEAYQRMRGILIDKFGDEDSYARASSKKEKRTKARDIQATVEAIDDGNPLFEMQCVFTAQLASMGRKEAMQRLKNVGGVPQDGVTRDTDYLVVGGEGFRDAMKSTSGKIDKAKRNQLKGMPIQIISEDVFLRMLEE